MFTAGVGCDFYCWWGIVTAGVGCDLLLLVVMFTAGVGCDFDCWWGFLLLVSAVIFTAGCDFFCCLWHGDLMRFLLLVVIFTTGEQKKP